MKRVWLKEESNAKWKESKGIHISWKPLAAAACICALVLTGCGGSKSYNNSASDTAEGIGFETYEETDAYEEAELADVVDEEDMEEPGSGAAAEAAEDTKGQSGENASAVQDKILVYEGYVSMDTMQFEDTVRAFKKTVEEYGGFLEDEQSYGGDGKFASSSSYGSQIPRSYTSTARIPSESYQDFMQRTEGLGNVTESSSRVTNMTRQYGTLKAELEIYEAEYERYLKMFEEVSDDNAMVTIQEKLTELSLDIARTKSEMSVIDTDAAFSTVRAQIYEVTAYEESGVGFGNRLVRVLGKSWTNMLKFFENLLFFLILHWYHFLILFLIVLVIFKIVKKSLAKAEHARQEAMRSRQEEQQKWKEQERIRQEQQENQEKNRQEQQEEQEGSSSHE